jgi:hypothetical protein
MNRPETAGRLERSAIVAVMAVASVFMWFGVPLGFIYLVSKLVNTTQPTFGPYLAIIVGVPLGMTLVGKGLARLDRHYQRRTAAEGDRYRPGWLKSMRDERPGNSRWKVLDVVMLWSVATAGLAMGVWFLFFAGSSIS